MEFMEILEHAVMDTIVFIPFLFLTYLVLTYVEHKDSIRFHEIISRYKYFGPLIGALLGIIPQCGFSVMAACLYLNSSISLGTLTAVFFATSDEAIPMLLAQPDQFSVLIQIIMGKVIFGIAVGYLVDLLSHFHFTADRPSCMMIMRTARASGRRRSAVRHRSRCLSLSSILR